MRIRGFSLIELVIAVSIMAILSTIAYPSYVSYIVRGNRSQGQQFLMDLAQRQERLRLDSGSYGDDPAAFVLPAEVAANYGAPELYVAAAGPAAFAASLSPLVGTPQAGDGRLFINSAGAAWRDPTSNCALAACSPSDPTAIAWK